MAAKTVAPGIVQLASGSYRATVSFGVGKRETASFPELDAAREWQARTRLDAQHTRNSARLTVKQRRATTVEVYWRTWLDARGESGRQRLSTRRQAESHYRNHVGPALGSLPIGRVDAAQLDRLVKRMKAAGAAEATAHRVVRNVRAMLEHARAAGYIAAVPSMGGDMPSGKRDPRKLRMLEADEAEAIIAAAGRYSALYLLMTETGARIGEASGLEVRDVDMRRGLISLVRQMTRQDGIQDLKDGEPRIVGMSPRLAAALAPLLDRPADAPLFTAPGGGRLSQWNLRRDSWEPMIAALMESGAVRSPAPSFHSFRHGAVSRMLAAGVSPLDVKEVTGHESLRTLEIYSHALAGAAQRAAAVFAQPSPDLSQTRPRAKAKGRR